MAIVRWMDPFKDIVSIQDRVNRLFEEFFARGRAHGEEPGQAGWMPVVDILETEDTVVVKAELPGMEKDQIGVEVRDGVLTLRGERKVEKETREENYHRVERSYGSFHRSFSLPASIDEEKVAASLKNGVLEIRLPKKEEAKPRQIKIAA